MSAQLRAGAVSRTEYASGAAGDCPQSVESAVLRAFEDASRTTGSLFEHGTHIPYHRWPSPVPNARHRGKLPLQRSLAYILVDLLRALGSAAINLVNFRLKSSLASQNTNKFKRTLPSVT